MKRFLLYGSMLAAAAAVAVCCNKLPFNDPFMPGGREDDGNDISGVIDFENPHQGHEWVDLGLSVLWASCNVGADSPEKTGGFYPWGDPRTQSDYAYAWAGYKYYEAANDALGKYNLSTYFGNVDNKTSLDASDDVASTLWGGSWRMPSRSEIEDLVSSCNWKYVTYKGVKGYEVSSKTTGGSIFLPSAGAWSNGELENENCPCIWSSDMDITGSDDDSLYGFALVYGLYEEGTAGYVRCCGLNVRAVIPVSSAENGGGNGGGQGGPGNGGGQGGPGNGGGQGGPGNGSKASAAYVPISISSVSGVRSR